MSQRTVMPSLVVIGQQIKEKRVGTMCPLGYIITKYPSLNRVNHLKTNSTSSLTKDLKFEKFLSFLTFSPWSNIRFQKLSNLDLFSF